MKPINELEYFLYETAFSMLNGLSSDTKPFWGEMNAQQMVEHLCLAVELSNGKRDIQLHTEKEKVEKLKAVMLLSNRHLPREFKNPALPLTPLPVTYKSIEEAQQVLKQGMKLFMQYFQNSVETTRMHNMFGALDYQEWLWFHYKHFIHHFIQFGLMEDKPRLD